MFDHQPTKQHHSSEDKNNFYSQPVEETAGGEGLGDGE